MSSPSSAAAGETPRVTDELAPGAAGVTTSHPPPSPPPAAPASDPVTIDRGGDGGTGVAGRGMAGRGGDLSAPPADMFTPATSIEGMDGRGDAGGTELAPSPSPSASAASASMSSVSSASSRSSAVSSRVGSLSRLADAWPTEAPPPAVPPTAPPRALPERPRGGAGVSDRRVVALSGVSDRRRAVALEDRVSFLPRRDGASRSSLRARPSPPRCPRESRRSRISSSWSKMECAASERCGESGRSYLPDPW
mmetsp:Transcript_7624/g.31437  ORF Transcript_7624/g.31437 Transcript_7624/m.31437 type:complete len:251 (-) Transcript_7624:142-894(-)